MTTHYAKILGLLLAIGVLGGTAHAQTEPWPYDGSGSRYYPMPSDTDDTDDRAKEHARIEAQRLDFIRGVRNHNNMAMISLAALLEDGVTTSGFDRAGALDLYEQAADNGSNVGRRKMCVAYFLGEGRPVDRHKGASYCNLLPQNDATHLFAFAYDTEHSQATGGGNDAILATYIEASKLGSADALDALGQKALALAAPVAARNWFRQGAALGSADAIDHLAVMAEAGQGAEADPDEAYWLYVNAANRGNAHARAWVAALPADRQPLGRMTFDENAAFLTETTKGDKGPHVDHLNLTQVAQALASVYPEGLKEAKITVHCYVGAAHNIDLCLPERQLPPGTDFTQSLNWLFYRTLTVSDTDTNGRSTAHTIMPLAFNWVMD